jgi:hypothetical protein
MLEQIVGEKIVTALLDQSMAPVDREMQYLVFIGGIPALLIEESFTPSCVEFCTVGMPAAR